VKPSPAFVLPVDKPEGPTSHDVVQAVRRSLGVHRAGHTGTLDPFASGLLLVCIGKATRLAEYLSGLDKTYEAVARLGQRTDTLDREGELLEERAGWQTLDEALVAQSLERFRGTHDQVPPAYSAKKIGGEAAHRRVRRGERVELPPVAVTVHEMELASFDLPHIGLRIRCSSGTYVRAIARDVGEALGVGAHLVSLRRIAIGAFHVADALTSDRLGEADAVRGAAIDPLGALSHLPVVVADAGEAVRLTLGQSVPRARCTQEGIVAVAHEGVLLAVCECAGGMLLPRKVFAE
jgi:tRNA pseudouridine55 synthase